MGGLGGYPVAIGHGTGDDVISIRFGREAKEVVEAAGAHLLYRESPLPHTIDPGLLPELRDFVGSAIPSTDRPAR